MSINLKAAIVSIISLIRRMGEGNLSLPKIGASAIGCRTFITLHTRLSEAPRNKLSAELEPMKKRVLLATADPTYLIIFACEYSI